ncbi:uncharacterized protein NEMAJ01_0367 [Nematocida major]|uniref:uncharacterized protein n=1 Tax=Nematocida major TaxID=1912982 RepID=UPI0020072382|nr:uncharacterized protein NEMAJ01_0367 [Nematocida major]KAH9385471.1 hypothetical protein NEMAJ01_0367 [Nematocida major]
MEPEVIIVEINGTGKYKVFSTGVLFVECTKEEVLQHFDGKLHMFILVNSNIDKSTIRKISGYFFENSQLESMSVMYSSVSTSLALGVQSLISISIENGPDNCVSWSVDLVYKCSLITAHSYTGVSAYDVFVDKMLDMLHEPVYKEKTANVHIKGDPELVKKATAELLGRNVAFVPEEDPLEDVAEDGYRLVQFPKYFTAYMPHNLLPDSNIAYVGAVLTIMINYFEIKEVHMREDFEVGHTKYLLLN